jgi:hypothetical protein
LASQRNQAAALKAGEPPAGSAAASALEAALGVARKAPWPSTSEPFTTFRKSVANDTLAGALTVLKARKPSSERPER